jgi:hypothetical protein
VGSDLLPRCARMPCDVRVDPHFEAVVASLSWDGYCGALATWATDKARCVHAMWESCQAESQIISNSACSSSPCALEYGYHAAVYYRPAQHAPPV